MQVLIFVVVLSFKLSCSGLPLIVMIYVKIFSICMHFPQKATTGYTNCQQVF